MALTANFIADFSSFMDATKDAVSAMQGFKLTAEELGPAADRGLAETQRQAEQLGRGLRQVGTDAVAASSVFIQAFTEEQDAVNALTTALTATGNATPAVVAQYAALATQFQTTTKYADEAIIAAQATLTTIGTVGPAQMELALTATTNLASAMKMDLNDAALLVAKAFESGGEHLGRLKTLLGDAYQPGMDAAEMLQAINEKFGPAAANELNTYNGKIENMKNQMSDLNEQVGGVLVGTLTTLLDIFRQIPEPIQTVIIAIGAIGTAAAPLLVSLSSLVTILGGTAIGAAAAAFAAAAGTVIAVMIGAGSMAYASDQLSRKIVANWDQIVGYTQRLYDGIKLWLVDKFNALVGMIQSAADAVVSVFQRMYQVVVGGSIVPDLIAGIGQHFARLDQEMVQPARAATDEVIANYDKMMRYQTQANAIMARNNPYASMQHKADTADMAAVADRIFAPTGGGDGGGVTVNNTINITGGDEALARRISEEIMRTIRSGTQLGTA